MMPKNLWIPNWFESKNGFDFVVDDAQVFESKMYNVLSELF